MFKIITYSKYNQIYCNVFILRYAHRMKLLTFVLFITAQVSFAQDFNNLLGKYHFEGSSGDFKTSYVLTIKENNQIHLSQIFSQNLGNRKNVLLKLQCTGIGALSSLGGLSTKVVCNDGKRGEQYFNFADLLAKDKSELSKIELYNSFIGKKQIVVLK